MTVLVTGGGGFLGSAIVDRLLARGERVRVLARSDYPALANRGVEVIRGDIAERESVDRAVAGSELVYHVAAKAGISVQPGPFERTNIEGTRQVIASCRRHRVSRLIYTSTPSVISHKGNIEGGDESLAYPHPSAYQAEYPRTKAIAEQAVLAAAGEELRTIALRPHLIWGPGDNHLLPRLIARARSGRLRKIGSGQPIVDTTYIDNAAQAHLQAADRLLQTDSCSGRAYFISNGEPRPLWEIVARLLTAAGVTDRARQNPKQTALFLGSLCEFWYSWTGTTSEPPLTRFLVHQLSSSHWFSISRARRDLGYDPAVSLEQGFSRLTDWFRSSQDS